MKILVLDNYDSFTYNLVHYLEELTGEKVTVARNDEITIEQAAAYERIVLSPGPGIPEEAGILKELILKLAPDKSILGICLGMQAIGEVFGGHLTNLEKIYHGVATDIKIKEPADKLFFGLPNVFKGGRYHSWVVDRDTLPECFQLTATDENGMVMGITHKQYDLRGLQFHPESVLTGQGKQIISNWLHTSNIAKVNHSFLDNDNLSNPDAFTGTLC